MVKTAPPSTAIAFLGKDPDERCELFFRQHWIRLLWPLTRLLLWMVILGCAAWATRLLSEDIASVRHIFLVFLACTWIAANGTFVSVYYRHLLYIVVVTNHRVHRIKRTLVTHNDHQAIYIRALQDILKIQHGPIQNFLGFGTLILDAQETSLRLHFIPNVEEKYERIMHIKEMEHAERVRRRSEVHEEKSPSREVP